jgi:TusA-related sulfurtransferase
LFNDKSQGGNGVSSNLSLKSTGEAFTKALAKRDFDTLEKLFAPEIRFRALVPKGVREGATAQEASNWLRLWFENADVFKLEKFSIEQVVDRLHISYLLNLHKQDGWYEIGQQIYCSVQNNLISDLALVCSGFRPVAGQSFSSELNIDHQAILPTNQTLGATLIYDAQDKGCADGSLEQIANLARSLSGEETLEIRATNPSVANDLPAWCRMAGYELFQQDGGRYFIRRPTKKEVQL